MNECSTQPEIPERNPFWIALWIYLFFVMKACSRSERTENTTLLAVLVIAIGRNSAQDSILSDFESKTIYAWAQFSGMTCSFQILSLSLWSNLINSGHFLNSQKIAICEPYRKHPCFVGSRYSDNRSRRPRICCSLNSVLSQENWLR